MVVRPVMALKALMALMALMAAAVLAAAVPAAAQASPSSPPPPLSTGQPPPLPTNAPEALALAAALPPSPPLAASPADAPAARELAAAAAAVEGEGEGEGEEDDPAALVAEPGEPGLPAAGAGEPLGDEFGAAYAVSVREANSLLNRLSARLKQLVERAWTFLGTPYRRGGTSRHGLDCSGLVGAVYAQQGVDMPRTAAEQFSQGTPVAESDLQPGDLVFFRDTYKRGISHVGIFVGDGRFIHAAGRRQGVIVSDLAQPYFRSRFAGARRLSPLVAAASVAAAEPAASAAPPAPTALASDLAPARATQR
jgi:cell wall-associated NlpC family hydrolase